MSDCFDKIRAVLPKEVSNEVINQFIRDAESISSGGKSPEQIFAARKAYLEAIQEKNEFYKKVKIDYLLKLKKSTEFYNQPGFKGDYIEALTAEMHGTNKKVFGARDDIYRRTSTYLAENMNIIKSGLDKIDGAEEIMKSGTLNRPIAREVYELREGGKPGASGSPVAQAIAKVIVGINKKIVGDLSRSGALIKYLDGYIFKQTHDPSKLRAATKDAWVKFIEPLLDSKTFDKLRTPGERQKFLGEAYDDIVFGKFEKNLSDDATDTLITIPRAGKLGARVGASRKLHFNDSEAFMEYNDKFGRQNLLEGVLNSARSNARNAAVMEVYGVNPKEGLAGRISRIKTDLKRKASDSQLSVEDRSIAEKSLKQFTQSAEKKLFDRFSTIAGEMTTDPGTNAVMRTLDNTRRVITMGKLGFSLAAQTADFANAAAQIASRNGDSYFGNLGKVITEFGKSLPKEGRENILMKAGVLIDDFVSNMSGAMSVEGAAPGLVSKMERTFYKYNGMRLQTEALKSAVSKLESQNMAEVAESSWKDLSSTRQHNFKAAGIDEAKWDKIRSEGLQELEGTKYILPETVKDRDAQLKLIGYLGDMAELSTSQPGGREKFLMLGNTGADTVLGQVRRMISVFKGVPITQIRVLSRILNEGNKSDMANMVQYMVATTGLAYVGMALKNAAKGKDLPDPRTSKTWVDAFQRGGAGAIYGDFLLTDYSSYGSNRDFVSDLAGPVFSEANKGIKLGQRILFGKEKHALVKGTQFVEENTPFLNSFWTKAALDNLILKHVYETVDPTYDLQQRMKKAQGR